MASVDLALTEPSLKAPPTPRAPVHGSFVVHAQRNAAVDISTAFVQLPGDVMKPAFSVDRKRNKVAIDWPTIELAASYDADFIPRLLLAIRDGRVETPIT